MGLPLVVLLVEAPLLQGVEEVVALQQRGLEEKEMGLLLAATYQLQPRPLQTARQAEKSRSRREWETETRRRSRRRHGYAVQYPGSKVVFDCRFECEPPFAITAGVHVELRFRLRLECKR